MKKLFKDIEKLKENEGSARDKAALVRGQIAARKEELLADPSLLAEAAEAE